MANFIIRTFVKDYSKTDLHDVRVSYGEVSGIVGIVTNLFLSAIKFIAGIIFKSISITADALNNLSDCMSSIVTLIGFKLSAKPADKEHPYGHARMEYISGLIVSIIIIFLGLELVQTSIKKIIELFTLKSESSNAFNVVSIVILLISIIVKLWLSYFYGSTAKQINSPSLKASSADSLNDVISTTTVLAGIVITKITGFNLDGFTGLLVAIFIIISGIKLIKETSDPLLGSKAPEELKNSIVKIIQGKKEILGFHDLRIHDYGTKKYLATVHLEMNRENDVEFCHSVIDDVERKSKEILGIELVAHLDPVAINDSETNVFRQKLNVFLKGISEKVSIHDLQIIHANPKEISFDLCVPYDFYLDDEHLKKIVTQTVKAITEEGTVLKLEIDHE